MSQKRVSDISGIEQKLSRPEKPSDKGIIFLPGSHGGSLTAPLYDFLASRASREGFNFFRFDIWKGVDDCKSKTFSEVFGLVNGAIEYMYSEGCERIGMIGKSFGGAVLLAGIALDEIYLNEKGVESLVLLAPTISCGKKGNISGIKYTKLGEVWDYKKLRINGKDLKNYEYPVLIVQGTDDDPYIVENSEQVVSLSLRREILYFDDIGHGLGDRSTAEGIMLGAVDFFEKTLVD